MKTFLRNTISKLSNVVSAPVAKTRDALAERLQSVHETTSLLYNRMMENMGYGQETLKNTVKKEAEEEEQQQKPAVAKEEEEAKEKNKYGYKNKIGVPRKMRGRIQGDWKFKKLIMAHITPHIEMRVKVIYSFKSVIYRRGGEMKDCSKTLNSPPGMFTSLREIQAMWNVNRNSWT